MNSQPNHSPKPNRADTSEMPMNDEDRFANVPAQLDGLLEDGEISPEAFALYRTMGARVVDAYRGAKEGSSPASRNHRHDA